MTTRSYAMSARTVLLAALATLPSLAAPAAQASSTTPAIPGRAAAKAKVAVLDFALAGSAHPDLARVLGDAAARGAGEDPTVQVMSQGEIVALLGLEKTRQMLGCTDDQGCVMELAHALDSDRLVSGALTILERTALVTVRLIDARKARTLARTSATLVDATEAELVEAARRLAHEALTGRRLDTTGLVRVQVSVKGAEVSLDGKSLGPSPFAAPQRVLEGPHSIVVQKPGYIRWSGSVSVAPGAEVPVHADLVPIQVVSEQARSRLWAWAWTSTGVFVLGTAGGVTFGRLAQSAHDSYQAATTRSLAARYREDTRSRALYANVSWGVAGASAAAATTLFVFALREDARAARESGEALQRAAAPAVIPIEGGAILALSGRF
jgi:hypothetical protein